MMTNAELIKALRVCADCIDLRNGTGRERCTVGLIRSAADAIQTLCDELATYHAKSVTDEKQIEDLQKQVNEFIKNETHSTVIKVMSRRIAELEALMPKEGEWKKILQNGDGTSDYQCSACLGIIMNVPDDDEHPLCSFCPNCGARMKWKPKSVENKQVAAYEYIAGTRVDFAMEDLTDCGRQILLGLKKDDKKEK